MKIFKILPLHYSDFAIPNLKSCKIGGKEIAYKRSVGKCFTWSGKEKG